MNNKPQKTTPEPIRDLVMETPILLCFQMFGTGQTLVYLKESHQLFLADEYGFVLQGFGYKPMTKESFREQGRKVFNNIVTVVGGVKGN
jgi:hypothetical protein